ncbi:MAG TPA: diacylglycerol kinase family protein [Patescibacteria group bacterium]|nr:diacylglycerol kinase family protein [Patescibacteria group bacterium]
MIDKYFRFKPKFLLNSFKYAFEGLWFSILHNQNIRIHFLVAFLVIMASIFFRVSAFEMGILGVMILLVIAAEMINTALEEMVNLITKEHRQEAKIAKDVSAGMVLVISLGSVVVGVLIFLPHILRLFR